MSIEANSSAVSSDEELNESTFEGVEDDVNDRSISSLSPQQSEILQPVAVVSPQEKVTSIVELLELIISFLDTPIEQRANNASHNLLGIALTSKAFFDPAMDVLWKSVESWVLILKIIPGITFLPLGGVCDRLFTTTDVLLKKDVQRVHLYTRRIRYLVFTHISEFVSPHIYSSIRLFIQGNLFPRLKTLRIPDFGHIYNDNLNGLFLTPSPTLSFIYIYGITPPTEVSASSLIFNLSVEAKSLLGMELSGQFGNIVFKILPNFEKLETLRLSIQKITLDIDLIKRCSELTNLKRLALSMDHQTSITHPEPPRIFRFGSLQTLDVTGPDSSVLSVLQAMRFVRLEVLKLKISSIIQGTAQSTTVKACLRRCSLGDIAASLTSIRVEADTVAPINWKELNLLKRCGKIERLDARIDYLSDTRIERMLSSQSWGNLKILKLECIRELGGPGESGGLWIYDLAVMAQNCPKLEILAISLRNIYRSPEDLQLLEVFLSGDTLWVVHGLEDLEILPMISCPLDLGNSVCHKPMPGAVVVSRFIFKVFPNIRNLTFPGTINVWMDGVLSMLNAYRAIRAQYDYDYVA